MTPRIRNPELHREAILAAAAQAFAEHGYRQATVRDIARRAGVTHGLVLRHFGSKETLFLAAVPGTRDLAELAGDPATLPERVAAGFVRRMEDSAGTDPFLALIRSAATDDGAAARLHVEMQDQAMASYREILQGSTVEDRVPFLAALLIGVTFSRYIVRAGHLATMSVEDFTAHLTSAVRGVLSR